MIRLVFVAGVLLALAACTTSVTQTIHEVYDLMKQVSIP